jgi:hypothetical protein
LHPSAHCDARGPETPPLGRGHDLVWGVGNGAGRGREEGLGLHNGGGARPGRRDTARRCPRGWRRGRLPRRRRRRTSRGPRPGRRPGRGGGLERKRSGGGGAHRVAEELPRPGAPYCCSAAGGAGPVAELAGAGNRRRARRGAAAQPRRRPARCGRSRPPPRCPLTRLAATAVCRQRGFRAKAACRGANHVALGARRPRGAPTPAATAGHAPQGAQRGTLARAAALVHRPPRGAACAPPGAAGRWLERRGRLWDRGARGEPPW